MNVSRRQFLQLGGMATVMAGLSQTDLAALASPPPQVPAASDPAVHFLNRISYGVTPADLARVRNIGIEAYLDEQLNPERIDNSELDEHLRMYPTLQLDRAQLYNLSNEYMIHTALMSGFVMRAVHSKHQLLERVTEFFSDHFNVLANDENTAESVPYQQDVIRGNAFGSFRDMLFATAKSPAMLYYLDNFINNAEDPNENYARELLELHTLGVDGGYTEQDVVEVARAFTGWTLSYRPGDGFYFDENNHDMGEKQVLGHTLPAGRGMEDGLHVLTILANHPSTARFVSTKLCRRFISDNPPQSIIDSTTQVWMQSGGDLKTIYRHMLTSDEFFAATGQKYRRPLDFIIGALRTTGTTFNDDYALIDLLERSGQPPYGWPPPNGYPDTAIAWINTSGLLFRWNAAMYLADEAYSSTEFGGRNQLRARIGNPATVGELVDRVAEQVYGIPLSPAQAAPFVDFINNGDATQRLEGDYIVASKLGTLTALMLASPLYQWR